MLKKYFKLMAFAFAMVSMSLTFSSCESSEIKGDTYEELEGSETKSPNGRESQYAEDSMENGNTGGVNTMDPEGAGGKIDNREDNLNSGSNLGTGAENTRTGDDGTRKPNEYSSGNTSGQYNETNSTKETK